MPEILPFRGLRYNQKKVEMYDVVAPPYDVISSQQQKRLYERSPYNVVRLILGREEDRYASAASFLEQWKREAVVSPDGEPSLYLLHQTFQGRDDTTIVRKGMIALCRLEEFDKKIVLPHEKTLSKPREDRLRLMKSTGANFSQIFSFYSDPEKKIDHHFNGTSKKEPIIDVTYEDVQNQVWRISDPSVVQAVQDELRSKQVLIADGHHRYETALEYREFMRSGNPGHTGNEPYNYVMMFFTNVDAEGLVIYPTHRLVHSLPSFDPARFLEAVSRHFIVREFKDEEAALSALESTSVPSFAVLMQGSPSIEMLSLRPASIPSEVVSDDVPDIVKQLDVTVLHSVILKDILGISPEAQVQKKNLEYVRDSQEAFQAVLKGSAQLAFVMNATKIQQVRDVAVSGYTMPQKSTFFYPKLLSGLVINDMNAGGYQESRKSTRA